MKKQYLICLPLLLLALALFFILPACKKDPPEQVCPPGLPCATQTGENTFACYINGQPWEAQVAPYIFDPTVHKLQGWFDELEHGTDHSDFLEIHATSIDSSAYDLFTLSFRPVTDMIVLNHDLLNLFAMEVHLDERKNINAGVYRIDTLAPYEIKLTKIDHENNIVSGQFFFTGLLQNKKDTIVVRDGRFDLRYHPE